MIEVVSRGEVVVQLAPDPPWSTALEGASGAIDAHWSAACDANPRLFDGRLFCVASVRSEETGTTLVGDFVPYRAFHAQRHGGIDGIGLDAVAVSGIVLNRSRNRVLIARRAAHSAAWPGAWELLPSGSLDGSGPEPLEWRAQLSRELREEARIESADWRTIGLIHDSAARLYEICAATLVHEVPFEGAFPEHEDLAFVDLDEAARTLEQELAVPSNRLALDLVIDS